MWWILWLALSVFLLIVELLAPELVSIWFSVAALFVAILTAIFSQMYWVWQVLIFAILSAILVASTRGIVKKILKRRENQETNLELILNHTAIVAEEINNDNALGAVKINGLIWNARSEDGAIVKVGELVVVQQIQGNKLIVKRSEEK